MTHRVQAQPVTETNQPCCPACGNPFSVSFMLLTMFFDEEQEQADGKQLQCPSCQHALWVFLDGEINTHPFVEIGEAW